MIFVDDILSWFRARGYAAQYGSLAQLNEQLTSVDYSASTDGFAAFVRLIGDQRTVDGHDTCDIAVHLSWLCPLDFDGETLLSTQETAKGVLKDWLHSLEQGNAVTVNGDARWQFGYDDFAENVAWVAVRVTLTDAAGDCVPLGGGEGDDYPYNLFCPQIVNGYGDFRDLLGQSNPVYKSSKVYCCIATPPSFTQNYAKIPSWVNDRPVLSVAGGGDTIVLTEAKINQIKSTVAYYGGTVTEETEKWLTDRIGYTLYAITVENMSGFTQPVNVLAAITATNYESKRAIVI